MPLSPKHKINIPDKAPQWGANDSLGQKLERALTRFVEEWLTWAADVLVDIGEKIVYRGAEILKPGALAASKPLLDAMDADPATPAFVRQYITAARTESGQGALLAIGGAIVMGIVGMAVGALGPVARLAEHKVDQQARSQLPGFGDLIEMQRRGALPAARAKTISELGGLSDELWTALVAVSPRLLALGDAASAWHRGAYTEQQFEQVLSASGFTQNDIGVIKQTAFQLPPLSDLITMMVREAFDDGVASRFGYDADFPGQALQLGGQLGIAPEWVRRYWRSHWQLPSPTQAYEMLHRGQIDAAQLDELLRISDYPPFWRERLRNISFSPITRVDLRRLYQTGVIDELRVFRGYKDIGYNDDDAQALTEFAIRDISETDRELTRADVLGAFGDDLYDESAARTALLRIGYDETETALLLARVQKDKQAALQKEAEASAKSLFVNRQISEAQAVADLSGAGLPESKIKRLLAEWRNTRNARTQQPSRADAERFLRDGIIDQAAFKDHLKLLGYADNYIEWYLAAALPEGVEVEPVTLSQSAVLSAYVADTLAENEARARLVDIGLAPTDVDVLIARADAQRQEKQQREVKSLVRLQFINQQIESQQARTALAVVGLAVEEIDALLAEWQRARNARTEVQAVETLRELSKSEALQLFKRGLLSESETRSSIIVAGIAPDAADLLIAGVKAELAERAADDAIDRARVQFLNDLIDDATARAVLAAGGLSQVDVAARLLEWQRSRELRAERLTQAQAFRLLKDNIISLNGYEAYLKILGFEDDELRLLVEQARLAIA
jgi:hypothetical protein